MTEETCRKDELIFDYSIVTSSLVEDFSMTCSDKYQRDILNSIYMIGSAIGSSSIGIVSDKAGRIKAMVLSLLCMGLPGKIQFLFQKIRFFTLIPRNPERNLTISRSIFCLNYDPIRF